MEPHPTRRQMLGTMLAGAAGICAETVLGAAAPTVADRRIRGPFPILSTPLTEAGEVDFEVLFKNMTSRQYGLNRTVPAQPIFLELKLNPEEIAEIDFRFDALKPGLKPNPPGFDAAAR